jgi:peptide/nickel transport system substrate-binding protein
MDKIPICQFRTKCMIPLGAVATAALLAASLYPMPAVGQVTVTLAQGLDPETLDPAYDTAIYARSVMSNIYDTLVWRTATGKVLPSLAESWDFPDNTTVQLNLRRGVKFHNGDTFTAADVLYSTSYYLDKSTVKPLRSYLRGLYDTIEKKDDYTVILHLKKPNSAILGDFARIPILPGKAMKAMGESQFGTSPIGTGPFKVARWDKNSQLVLEAFADHWRGPPSIDRFVIKPIPEDFGRFAALRTGAVDIVANLAPERVADVEKNPKLKVLSIPSARVMHIRMNTKIKPFDDARVRRALNYAVDVPEIVETVLGGHGYPNASLCGKQLFGHDASLKFYEYDPAKAKQLLAEAGYPNGFTTKMLTPTGRYMKDREIGSAIAGQLARVGVKVELVTPEWADFDSQQFARGNYKNRPFQGMMFSGTGGPTLDCGRSVLISFATSISGRWGDLYYRTDKSAQIEALYQKQRAEFEPAKRLQILKEIQALARDDAPWIYLYDQQDVYGVAKRVQWKPRPDEFIWAYDIKVKE